MLFHQVHHWYTIISNSSQDLYEYGTPKAIYNSYRYINTCTQHMLIYGGHPFIFHVILLLDIGFSCQVADKIVEFKLSVRCDSCFQGAQLITWKVSTPGGPSYQSLWALFVAWFQLACEWPWWVNVLMAVSLMVSSTIILDNIIIPSHSFSVVFSFIHSKTVLLVSVITMDNFYFRIFIQ